MTAGDHRPTDETPFEWCFVGGPIFAREAILAAAGFDNCICKSSSPHHHHYHLITMKTVSTIGRLVMTRTVRFGPSLQQYTG